MKKLLTKEVKIVIGLVLFAGFFRLWGVSHGFPFIFHPDEPAVVRSAIGIRFDPNPNHFDWPHLYFYLNYVLFGVFAKFRGLINHVGLRSTLEPIAPLYWRDPLVFYLLSRCLSALLGALTVVPVYLAGKILKNKKVGIAAALALSLMPHHVHTSHFALIDVPTAFFIAWAIYFSAKIFEQRKLTDYLFAGLFVGFAASTKYNGGLSAVVVATAHILRIIKNKEKFFDIQNIKFIILSGLTSVFGFVLGTPYAILDWDTFVRSDSPKGALWQFKNVGKVTFLEQLKQFGQSITYGFAKDFGHTFIAVYVLFIIYWFTKLKDKIAWFILVPSLFLFFYTAGFEKQRTHYFLTVYPFVALAVGYFVDIVCNKIISLKKKNFVEYFLRGLFMALIFILPLVLSFGRTIKISRKDTRVELYQYLEKVVLPQSHIIYNSDNLEPIMNKFQEEMVHKNITEENLQGRSGYIVIDGLGEEDERELIRGYREVLKIDSSGRRGEDIYIYVF